MTIQTAKMHSRTPVHWPWIAAVAILGASTVCIAGLCAAEPATEAKRPVATGAFVQLSRRTANGAAWWYAELEAMKRQGMDTVIVAAVANGRKYYYPTRIPGSRRLEIDLVESVISAADRHGLKVYLGLHLDREQFDAGKFDVPSNLAQAQVELDELRARYGGHASLAGWYMPQEVSDYMVFHQPQLRDDVVAYTKAIVQKAHASGGLPVMMSPFFGQKCDAAAYAKWWDETGLPRTGIDVVALQDGVGTRRTTAADAVAVFKALQPVMAKHRVAFWANNESFYQIHGWPVDDQPWAAEPTKAETFVAQIESTLPFVEKSITFEFCTYLSPQGSAAAQRLHREYQAHIDNHLDQ